MGVLFFVGVLIYSQDTRFPDLTDIVNPAGSLGVPEIWTTSGGFTKEELVPLVWPGGNITLNNLETRLTEHASVLRNHDLLLGVFRMSRNTQELQVEFFITEEGLGITGYLLTQFSHGLPHRILEYPADFQNPIVRTLRYTSGGLLQGLNIESPDKAGVYYSYQWQDGRIQEERIASGQSLEVRTYDPAGLMIRMKLYQNDVPVEERDFAYENRMLVQRITRSKSQATAPALDSLEEVTYDHLGRERERVVFRNGVKLSETSTSYVGEKNQVSQISTRDAAGNRIIVNEYDDEMELQSREIRIDGMLHQRFEYSGNLRLERYFLEGREILRVHFNDNQKIREEEIRNGQVLRTRNYSPGGTQ